MDTSHNTLNLAFVTLAGKDRFSFLQALVSADVSPLKDGFVVWSNLLSPQGRILFNFLIIPIGEGLWLSLPSSQVSDLHNALAHFLVKEKVHIATNHTISTHIAFPSSPPSLPLGKVSREHNTLSFRDPRSPSLGIRSLQTHTSSSSPSLYAWLCYRSGICEHISSIHNRTLLPLEAGHHLFKAISFEKGCFIGQEINMRLFHRGGLKRMIFGASSPAPMDTPLPLNTPLSFPHNPSLKGHIITSLLHPENNKWAGLILAEGQIKDTSSFLSALSHDTLLSLSPSQEQNHG